MLKTFRWASKGTVSVIAALILPVMIGMTGLVAEYGNGVLAKAQNQRVADLAAYAGAIAYNSTSSSTTMTAVIDNVASLNGVAASHVSGAVVTSPTGDGNQSVQVTINTTVPLILSQLVKSGASLPVTAMAYAEMKSNSPGCFIALKSSGSGVTLSSAASVAADACSVQSNATVSVPCASSITTITVDYDSSSTPSEPCNSITAPAGKSLKITKTPTADPMSGNSEVSAATARLTTVAALASPGAPSVTGGTAVSFTTSAGTTKTKVAADGCTAALSGGTWTVTCASGGTYTFGAVTASSGAKVNFVTSGSGSTTTFKFNGGISVTSASAMTFPAGDYDISQGVTVASASTASFGAGAFDIGPGAACTDGGKYSLCVESSTSLTFGGPSTFTLAAGIYAGSAAKVTLGSGSTNSFQLGSSSNGNAVYTSSGSNLVLADATGGSSVFEAVGNIDAVSASCVTLPNAAEHDIDGALIAASASNTTLGEGVYTVHGYVDDEAASGGGGCLGTTAGQGTGGVTFVIDAAHTPASGSCSGMAICVLSASSTSLVAPTTGATAGFAVIGPISSTNTAGALFSSASSGSFSGIFYMPNGPINVSSASSLGGGSGACLELIASQINVTSASAVGTTCVSGSSTNSSVILVQ